MGLFWRQFKALFVKNWIVILRHPLLNFVRCLLFPIAYGIFLAYAQNFFAHENNYGLGTPIPIPRLEDSFDGSLALVWADNTDKSGLFSGKDVMARVTAGFTASQKGAVREVSGTAGVFEECPSNFNGFSQCFSTITFDSFPSSLSDAHSINYTIWLDSGLSHVDVQKHDSSLETRFLPLQWAVDRAIIELTTGSQVLTSLEWPFTFNTNESNSDTHRWQYLSLISVFVALPFLLAFLGIVYQLSGNVAPERATALSSHMKAMGLLDSARIISWHASMSLAYFPAWFVLAFVWKHLLFVRTNVGLVLAVHVITGLSLASWSFIVTAPFGKSPQLASVVASGLALVLAVVPVMITNPDQQNTILATVLSFFFPSMFFVFALKVITEYELESMSTNAVLNTPGTTMKLLPMMIVSLISIVVYPCIAVWIERSLYGVSEPRKGFWSKRKGLSNEDVPPGTAISLRNLGKIFRTTSRLGLKKTTTIAVQDLTLDVQKHGIIVLLGPNGAGKSTILSILGGLTGPTDGMVVFEGGASRPPRGTLGIVPQKNVLFPELSCLQSLRVWNAVKDGNQNNVKDLEQLLRDCDLHSKIYSNAGTLSGGQKRKLQLAIGLVGGSEIVLVDECTSGVDPLSRRALWKTLTTYRNDRTILLTTHVSSTFIPHLTRTDDSHLRSS